MSCLCRCNDCKHDKKRLRFLTLLRYMRNAIQVNPKCALDAVNEAIAEIQSKNSEI